MGMASWFIWRMSQNRPPYFPILSPARPDAAQLLPLVRQMIASAESSHELATHATESALKIFTADTSAEAKVFADEVADIVTKSQQGIDDAYRAGLELAEISPGRHGRRAGAAADY